MNTSRGFAPLIIVMIVAIGALVIGGGYMSSRSSEEKSSITIESNLTVSQSVFTGKDFSVSGSAKGVSKVLVWIVYKGLYGDDLAGDALALQDVQCVREKVVEVQQERWTAAFGSETFPLCEGEFDLRIYDVSGRVLTWMRPGGYPDSEGKCEPACEGVMPLAKATLVVQK